MQSSGLGSTAVAKIRRRNNHQSHWIGREMANDSRTYDWLDKTWGTIDLEDLSTPSCEIQSLGLTQNPVASAFDLLPENTSYSSSVYESLSSSRPRAKPEDLDFSWSIREQNWESYSLLGPNVSTTSSKCWEDLPALWFRLQSWRAPWRVYYLGADSGANRVLDQ